MKTIRTNVFETNSSSTHSVVLRPINMEMIRAAKNGVAVFGTFPFCENKKMLVLDKKPGFEFGVYTTFYEKLNYVVCLLLSKYDNELHRRDKNDWWDNDSFDLSKANKILNTHYKDFCDKIAKYVSRRYEIDCETIGYLASAGKGGRTGSFNFDHEVLCDVGEPDLHLKMDLVELITTEGLAILYEFA